MFAKLDLPVQKNELDKKIEELHKYGIIPEEIIGNTVRFFIKKYGSETGSSLYYPYTNTHNNIRDLKNHQITNIKAKVVQIWTPSCEKIKQSGLVGDETSTTEFQIGKSATVCTLENGVSYEFKRVIVRPWMGQMSIYINKDSVVSEIQEDIKVKISAKQVEEIFNKLSSVSNSC